ncbi:hypothetical protein L9F63_001734, partial [Diploptera punctata]
FLNRRLYSRRCSANIPRRTMASPCVWPWLPYWWPVRCSRSRLLLLRQDFPVSSYLLLPVFLLCLLAIFLRRYVTQLEFSYYWSRSLMCWARSMHQLCLLFWWISLMCSRSVSVSPHFFPMGPPKFSWLFRWGPMSLVVPLYATFINSTFTPQFCLVRHLGYTKAATSANYSIFVRKSVTIHVQCQHASMLIFVNWN